MTVKVRGNSLKLNTETETTQPSELTPVSQDFSQSSPQETSCLGWLSNNRCIIKCHVAYYELSLTSSEICRLKGEQQRPIIRQITTPAILLLRTRIGFRDILGSLSTECNSYVAY
ncbi:hypothetical protein NPIL_537201 [Nephila pilipes]|uniref:Uncharacterized protein n=1 Tax=Nephila pilipes TaxID=299642 RepID=A0A8X6N5L7_NEPPI|nr:hypothetical protein NPIL_537201 [Nephila pilipes]